MFLLERIKYLQLISEENYLSTRSKNVSPIRGQIVTLIEKYAAVSASFDRAMPKIYLVSCDTYSTNWRLSNL